MRNLQRQLRFKSSTTDIIYIWYTKTYMLILWFLHKNYSTHHLFSSIKAETLSKPSASFSAISGRFRLRPPPRPSKFPGFPPVATHVTMPAEAASLSQLQGKQDSHETDWTNKTWWCQVSLTYIHCKFNLCQFSSNSCSMSKPLCMTLLPAPPKPTCPVKKWFSEDFSPFEMVTFHGKCEFCWE